MDFASLLTRQFGIKNYRSFGEEGILLNSLAKINLLIGKNNCGKSNVLRFLKEIQEVKGGWGNVNQDLATIHKGSTTGTSLFLECTHRELGLPEEFQDNISGQMPYRPLTVALCDPLHLEFNFRDGAFSISGLIKNKTTIGNKIVNYAEPQLFQSILAHMKTGGQATWQAIEQHFRGQFMTGLLKFSSRIIYIPDFRQITRPAIGARKTDFTSLITGDNIIKEIHRMRNPRLGDENNLQKFRKIEETVKNLLDAGELSIEIPSEADMMILTIDGNRFALESLGTGLHEIILLCSALIMHDDSIVCMEEPEIHLHPALQRKFIRFLYETNHQYFIATHSNVFIDDSHPDQATFHIAYDGTKSTITRVHSPADVRRVIDELGYKASDLIQTNGIIWVEGPSDRLLLKKWLQLAGNPYEEGIHFSILFYGGKLLSHLSFDDEASEGFIRVVDINPNSLVLIDRDSIGPDINLTKTRITREIGEDKSWVTQGLEIENYLSERSVNAWLKSKEMHPITGGVSPDKKIDALLQSTNPGFEYSKRKPFYMAEITNHIDIEDLQPLDLNARIAAVLEHIKAWNT